MRQNRSLVAIVVALSTLCADGVFAQSADGRLRTVVMGMAGRRGIEDKGLVAALSSVVLGTYAKDPTRVVIGPEDIARALEWEASKQQMGCTDNSCLAEVGAALDASRIVAGTLDSVGDVYIVTLSELDARTLERVGRVQVEVKRDEAALLDAVRNGSAEILRQAGAAGTAVLAGVGAGIIETESDPNGADIIVGEKVMGTTPNRIDGVPAGRQRVRLTRRDYQTAEFDVPVHNGGITVVRAELRLQRAIAEKNIRCETCVGVKKTNGT